MAKTILELAKDPPSRNRPVPFWSWNDRLEADECVRQIELMHQQGIGGFCQEYITRLKNRGACDYPPQESWGRPDAALVEKYGKANMNHFYIRNNPDGEKVVL